MKNFIILIIFLLGITQATLSQEGLPYSPLQAHQEGFHLGAYTLLGHSSIAPQNRYGFTELDPKLFFAFSIGVKGGLKFTNQWSVFVEYNFSRLGGGWSGKVFGIETTREVRVEYWQIPLLLRYNWTDNPRFYLTAGPQIYLLKTAQQLFEPAGNELPGQPRLNGDITNRFKRTTWGGVLGAGVEVPFTAKLYGIFGVRFSFTAGDINSEFFRINNSLGEYTPSRIYYPALEIGLAYIFSFH